MLDKQFSGEAFNDPSVFAELDKTVMLFCCSVCKRLKPVRIMSYIERFSPTFHAIGNQIGHFTTDGSTFFNGIGYRLISFFRKIFLHFLTIEYMTAIIIG